MAYRQLCAVTFAVLGLTTVGCGGGTSSNGTNAPAGEQEPPTNADQAPNNATDTATNPDVAPSNPDGAPSSSDDTAGSGGGRLGALCQKVCSTLTTLADDCSGG